MQELKSAVIFTALLINAKMLINNHHDFSMSISALNHNDNYGYVL
ncbi:hypothetical protein ACLSYX_02000 [[Pasteurella] aerogenes]|nr:hypothetical protein [[Pasteurella] aerogenes]MDY4480175.1 hypothetical protein [[Pasteurella] aerogenes]MDY4595250.1 hypothetical protein [[Pasteurella] aerogenes]